LSIYTKIGDKGQTMLQDSTLIPKHHPVIQALSTLDELNAHMGIIKSQIQDTESLADIKQIQKTIMTMMSIISTTKKPNDHLSTSIDELFTEETSALEIKIDRLSSIVPPIKSFVAYGACPKSASFDLARAVARRAETLLSQAAEVSSYVQGLFPYINRLSDYLYMKARYFDFEHSITEAVQDALKSHSLANEIASEITLTQAKAMLEKIEHQAKALNLPVVAACCNAAGTPIAVHVMDGALLVSYEAATAKAHTAAALKMPTRDLSKLVQPGQPFYGLEAIGNGKILPIGGGVPLFDQSKRLIGAIGVSGGTAEEDHDLASIGRSNPSAS